MIRPPIPKGEKPAITIANLERENDNLANRIEHLSKSVSELRTQLWNGENRYRELETKLKNTENMMHSERRMCQMLQCQLEEHQAKIAKLESVLCGYRQAICDVHGHEKVVS